MDRGLDKYEMPPSALEIRQQVDKLFADSDRIVREILNKIVEVVHEQS